MTKAPSSTVQALETRAEELRYLGSQYAMNGVEPPPELVAEFEVVQASLRALAARGVDNSDSLGT
ncbi:MAG: hypothetical protein RIT81_17660 [Deltaproteobacteria bacterium]